MTGGGGITAKLTEVQHRPPHPLTPPPPFLPSSSMCGWGHCSHPMLLTFTLWWGKLLANSSNFSRFLFTSLNRQLTSSSVDWVHFMIRGPVKNHFVISASTDCVHPHSASVWMIYSSFWTQEEEGCGLQLTYQQSQLKWYSTLKNLSKCQTLTSCGLERWL